VGRAFDSPSARRIAVASVVGVLLVATAGAFAVAERLKLERSPIAAPRFDRLIGPTCECETATARLQVRLRGDDTIDASIVDGRGEHVRTLGTGLRRTRGNVAFMWDGLDDDGGVVRDGRYRLRLRLARADRTITVPIPIRVDTTPPRLRLVSATPRVISPDGDGRGDRVLYRYRTNEDARPLVYVDGTPAVRSLLREAGPGRVRWQGRVNGRLPRAGTFATALALVDAAGNESERSSAVPVRIRYVDLRQRVLRARAGGRLRFVVDADARAVRWVLATRRGRRIAGGIAAPGPVAARIPRDARAGRYVLRVTVRGKTDRAVVVLRR
jgi:FlgD Ig-like domain